jgi:hypothetical protein
LDLEKRQEECEARKAARLEEAENQAQKLELWDRVMKMMEHTNPLIRAKGNHLAEQLAKEEGIDI